MAEYKGSGLAIVLSTINNVPAGGPFDDQRTRPNGTRIHGTCSHRFAAYDVAQFTDLEAFTAKVRALRERIRGTSPRAGFERVYPPGDIENEKAHRHRAEGIPLEQFTLDDLARVAEHMGVAFDIV
jgi:LDH2 family malate/lactate/ureidoglycolate dehydrogenase